ncbi:uncharacterized protein LOC127130288 [Lathyrus oleraceus]|uniref:uncharacterized protein LOC127130288 n=1 Tax=Pisum sativum TaxID=3888 RepID=UPI0021CE8E0D|nr:uncharacterized protein LOC127130288 [Pisum sativum]
MVETLIANQAAQAAQLQTAQAQVAEAQDAQIQAQAQATEMRNQMLTARLQAEEAQARAQVHNSGQTSAHNQPQIQNQTTAAPVTTVIASEINAVPVTSVTITASRPWEIPRDLNQDRYQQEFVPPNAPVFTNVPPVVHYTPHLGEPVYHGPTPSEDPGLNDRMDEFQDQFAELQKEIKALRGKELFGRDVNDMCLVPDVRMPAKFKLPEFEKYKGSSCPQTHLVMYVQKMSMYTNDQRMLIHYFQDSLTGAALRWYMGLDSSQIKTFNDLGEAFIKHYKYNLDNVPDRDQLRSMQQREKETFREYAQRWREIAAQVVPPMEEKEMTKVFLKTLDTFYYERMIASAPTDFTDMVNMGVRLEEAVREGRLVREGSSSSSGAKRYDGFMKKKEQETNVVSYNHPRRINYPYHSQHQHIAAVTPVITSAPVQVQYPQQRTNRFQQNTQYQQQHQPQQHQHQLQQRPPQQQRRTNFDPIPMSYAELYPSLITKNLVQPRPRPPVPEVLPWWYKPGVSCPFHQNAPGHDLDNCFALKLEVQKLTRAGILTFKSMGPNVKDNPMPSHGPSSVNNIEVCLNGQRVTKIEEIRQSLVEIHSILCAHGPFQHDHQICGTCSVNSRGCRKIQDDLQGVLDQGLIQISRQMSSPESQEQEVNVIIPCFNIPEKVEIAYHPREPVVICPPGPMPYTSDKAVPYRYAATIIENGKEVEIKTLSSVTNIAANSRMTRSGRVFAPSVIPSRNVEKDPVVVVPVTREAEGQTSNLTLDKETDELLRIIKLNDYKVVDQLLQTPSKISILSLLLNSAVHREALLKVLDQAFVEQDITAEQFNNVVGSITSCNGLGFCDEELPEEGKNHNFALHISANCQGDSLSNILIDTGSSLNVMPKSTLLKLKYKGGQMRHSGIIVKAFDGSRKTVIGEVDFPIGIGPHVFQITFQVMDIVPAYSCLLGRPWIHEAGAITSTLHQKLKFVKNGQIVTVNGEQAMLISHLSSFSVIEVDETAVQTPFQALTIDDYKKSEGSIASFKDAQQIVKTGPTEMWGKVIELPENVNHAGLGFVDGKQVQTSVVRPFKDIFHSGGFINMVAVEEDTFEGKTEDEGPRFVTPGSWCLFM